MQKLLISKFKTYFRRFVKLVAVLLLLSGVLQPASGLFQLSKLESFFRHYVRLSSSSTPFAHLNGFDFNIPHEDLGLIFQLSDGSEYKTTLAKLTQELKAPHYEKIYWTYPLLTFAVYKSEKAKELLTQRFCKSQLDPGLSLAKIERSASVTKIGVHFNTKPEPLHSEILCSN